MTPELKSWLEEKLLEEVASAYQTWRERNARYQEAGLPAVPEPTLSCTALRDLINQYSAPREWEILNDRKKYQVTYNALNRLTKEGKLESSLAGIGNREVRCWNPKETL